MLQRYIFTTYGRLNRLRYIKYGVLFGLAALAVNVILDFIAMLISGSETGFLVQAVDFIVRLIWGFGYFALIIRRLHDLDRPDWWVIGALIPVVNFALGIYLLAIPGTIGRNQYGEDPLQY